MAAERDPRVYFAAERTLLAWIRTGLAMMGFGFVVARFSFFLRELAVVGGTEVSRGRGSLLAGTALVVLGVAVNVHAAVTHSRFRERFEQGDNDPKPSNSGIILALLLALIGIGMAVYLVVS